MDLIGKFMREAVRSRQLFAAIEEGLKLAALGDLYEKLAITQDLEREESSRGGVDHTR